MDTGTSVEEEEDGQELAATLAIWPCMHARMCSCARAPPVGRGPASGVVVAASSVCFCFALWLPATVNNTTGAAAVSGVGVWP